MTRRFRAVAVAPGLGLTSRAMSALRRLSDSAPVLLEHWPPPVPSHGVDALIAGWQHVLDADALSALPDLTYVALRATSTDRVDQHALKQRGIALNGITHYGDNATAEWVLGALLQTLRTPLRGRFAREARGRRLGLVGFGAVAQTVAAGAAALGMDVAYYAPSGPRPHATAARYLPLDELLTSSDVVSVHTPARTPVLDAQQLALLPAESVLVVTTLGLPFAIADFSAAWPGQDRRAVFDLVAAHDNAESLAAIPGCRVEAVYAARSEESAREAEDQIIQAIFDHLHASEGEFV
ncbi:NAD(P)-dependent oxidoreductase [Streptomyces sp. NPDC086549]|uniref:NAD(P)-dependent oxidoreductase n=1 Tax=Streptomyces sp. NPDC086549 TaxID=3365752 RepID=UPI0037F7EF2B